YSLFAAHSSRGYITTLKTHFRSSPDEPIYRCFADSLRRSRYLERICVPGIRQGPTCPQPANGRLAPLRRLLLAFLQLDWWRHVWERNVVAALAGCVDYARNGSRKTRCRFRFLLATRRTIFHLP